MPSYIDYQVQRAPTFLSGRWGTAWLSSMGSAKNVSVDAAIAAVNCRFIANSSISPDDALVAVGHDRGLEQVPGETNDAYRARLVDAWNAYQWAGTKKGLLDQLAIVGCTNVQIQENWEYTGPGADPTQWWRFWITIRAPHPFGTVATVPRWGSGFRWGDGHRWGGIDKNRADLVKRIVRKWKPAHAQCVKITILMDAKVWGDHVTKWGDGTKWGGGAAVVIVP